MIIPTTSFRQSLIISPMATDLPSLFSSRAQFYNILLIKLVSCCQRLAGSQVLRFSGSLGR